MYVTCVNKDLLKQVKKIVN